MNQQHALIWRLKKADRSISRNGMGDAIYGPPAWTTTILAVGDMDDMQQRWRIADERLRRHGLDGHLEVRSTDDPKTHIVGWTGKTHAPGSGDIDPEAARLAIMPLDRVRVSIYGIEYPGTVTSAAIKGCRVRFNALTKTRGGWGGQPANRERPFPIIGSGRTTVLSVSRQQRREMS